MGLPQGSEAPVISRPSGQHLFGMLLFCCLGFGNLLPVGEGLSLYLSTAKKHNRDGTVIPILGDSMKKDASFMKKQEDRSDV